jgi:hypothetical protein
MELEKENKNKDDQNKGLNRNQSREKEINAKPELTQKQKREKWGLINPKLKEVIDQGLSERVNLLQSLEKMQEMDNRIFGLVKELALPIDGAIDGTHQHQDALNLVQKEKENNKDIGIELKPGERFIKGDKDYAVIERDNVPGHQIVIDKRQNLDIIQGPDKDTSWIEAQTFVEKIKNQSGQDFRLPMEDELKGLYNSEKGNDNWNKTEFLPIRSEIDGAYVWSSAICNDDGELDVNGSSAWGFDFNRGSETWPYLDDSDCRRGFAVRSKTSGK